MYSPYKILSSVLFFQSPLEAQVAWLHRVFVVAGQIIQKERDEETEQCQEPLESGDYIGPL